MNFRAINHPAGTARTITIDGKTIDNVVAFRIENVGNGEPTMYTFTVCGWMEGFESSPESFSRKYITAKEET